MPVTPNLRVKYLSSEIVMRQVQKGELQIRGGRYRVADLYESFAFARGIGIPDVLLTYPRPHSQARLAVGGPAVFDRIEIEDCVVTGVDVECRGLARQSEFEQFASRLSAGLEVVSARTTTG